MGKVRKVGTAKNKTSEIINNQKSFMQRWNVDFDNNNLIAFRNRIIVLLKDFCPSDNYLVSLESKFFYQVGIAYVEPEFPYSYSFNDYQILKVFGKLDFTKETHQPKLFWWLETLLNIRYSSVFAEGIAESLVASGINAQLCKSGSKYLFYPAGAELLDKKVVNDVLNWLDDYDKSKEKFNQALLMFQKKGNPRNILDNLRLSYELFLREFFQNEKSLENQKTQMLQFLELQQVPKEIRNMHQTLFSYYTSYNNENVKHNDNCSENEIEFIIYLTGTFIRFMIQTKSKEAPSDEQQA